MSDTATTPSGSALQKPVPAWIGAGIIGLVLGAGLTLVGTRIVNLSSTDDRPPSASGGPGGGGMGMGMGMGMGGGGGGGGGGGMGRGPSARRSLPTLVGKLELLTRETLHIELTPEQSAKIADQLAKLEQAETMTEEEAQAQLEALEGLLSPDQKAVADSISLPFGRPGGGGGFGGGPGGPQDGNPFRQETNQQRLSDLLGRIQPAGFKPPAKTEEPEAKQAEPQGQGSP